MKNIFFLSSLLSIILIVSCSEMNDFHQEYLDRGETIYAAMVDSVAPYPGFKRIEFEMFVLAQRIDKVRIYWNDKNDSLDVIINGIPGIYKQKVENLEEGEYIFSFVSFDKYANKSLDYELSASCYGEIYVSGLVNRRIDNISIIDNDLIITWRPVTNEDAIETLFSYQNLDGDIDKISISKDENSVVISNAKRKGKYWYKTLYLPFENAIDTVASPVDEGILP